MKDWTKHEEAKRLRDSGMKLSDIGAKLGVCKTTVSCLLKNLERKNLERRNLYLSIRVTEYNELHWWDGLEYSTRDVLIKTGFNSREDCMFFASDKLTMWRGSIVLPGWEEDKSDWRWSKKKLPLAIVNEVRAWLGVDPYVPVPRVASNAELDRARRLLERHGWRVEPPIN